MQGRTGPVFPLIQGDAERVPLASGRFDLVVSDLGLPDGDGTDLMRDVRSRHNLRGIAVTGHSDDAVVSDCKAAGFDRYFVKPIHFDDLRAAISEMLPQRPAAASPL